MAARIPKRRRISRSNSSTVVLPSPPARYAPEVLLTTEFTAHLIGRSKFTLQRARHDRPDLRMPPCVRILPRAIRYPLSDLVLWAHHRGVTLRWSGVPLSFALPAFRAFEAEGLRVPADLAALAGRVRKGR